MFTELKACVLKIKNVSKTKKNVNIYVPNRDCMPCVLAAGGSFNVTTLSAGESYFYYAQAEKDALEVSEVAADG